MSKTLLIISLFFMNSLFSKELHISQNISKSTREKVSLQLEWLDQFQFAGYYVAKEKGFYEDVGLDVEIKKYTYGLNLVTEVTSKRATYGIGRSSLVVERSKGAKIKILAAIFQSSPLIFLTTKASNINTVKDFKNKRMMSTADVDTAVSLNAMLIKDGLKEIDIITQKHSFNVSDLTHGKTDLMAAYISNEPFELQQKGVEYTIFDPKDYGFDFYADLLFTSDDEIENHKQRAINFNNATIKGWDYAFSHINETVELILHKYNVQNKSKEALIYEAQELKKLAYYNLAHNQHLGYIDIHKIKRIYDIYNVMNFVKNTIDFNEFIFYFDKHSNINLTKEERKYLKDKKQITMCIDPNWMPFEKFDKNGKHVGMSADYYKIIKKELNLDIKVIQTKTWDESLQNAKSRKCDILSLAMSTPKREKYLTFTSPYLKTPLVVVTKKDITFIDDIKTIKERKLGITKGYAFVSILKNKYPNLHIVEVQDIHDGLNKVKDSTLFGFIGTLTSISYQFQNGYGSGLKISSKLDEKLEIGVGVRSDDEILVGILEKAVNSLDVKDKQKILNNWVSIKYEIGIDYTLVWELIVLFLFILSIIVYFLFKQHRLKTKIELLNRTLEDKVSQAILEIKNQNTKLQEKTEQLFYQSRLAQMGEMISMIAHQWRQPLAAISIATANLKLKLELETFALDTYTSKDACTEYFIKRLGNIDNYVENLTKTIDDFRNFYKPNKKKQSVKLEVILVKALNIIKDSLSNDNIEIIYMSDATKELEVYDSELMQVFLNILKNAQDSFKEKEIQNPKLIIEVHDTQISITNNAGGISESIIAKIFDPYFSTKDEKNGTGLGLYMSKTIVQEHHNGTLEVFNTNDGVCFKIHIKR